MKQLQDVFGCEETGGANGVARRRGFQVTEPLGTESDGVGGTNPRREPNGSAMAGERCREDGDEWIEGPQGCCVSR